jgi:hypothetical protein
MVRAFPEEGYAIIRNFEDGRLDFRNSFYLFFAAGAHEGRVHRQTDDLSFVLSYDGQEILIDPGVYSYKRDEGRKYVKSTAAHNTVVLDSKCYKGWNTKLDSVLVEDRYTLIHGSHRNYPGFEHNRWVLYLRPTLIFVIDRVEPLKRSKTPAAHQFEQIFHFAPDLHVELNMTQSIATVFSGRTDSCPVLMITQLSELKPSMRVAKGEQSPMQGWHSQAHAQLIPTPTLISKIEGQSAEYDTVLELFAHGQSSQASENMRRDFQIATEAEIVNIRWSEGKKMFNMRLNLNTENVSIN